jgi:hypothetical protein
MTISSVILSEEYEEYDDGSNDLVILSGECAAQSAAHSQSKDPYK